MTDHHPLSHPVPIVWKGDDHPVASPKIALRIDDGAGFDKSRPAFPEAYGELMHGRQGATWSLILEARFCHSVRASTDLPPKAWLHNQPRHAFGQAATFEALEPVVYALKASPEVVI